MVVYDSARLSSLNAKLAVLPEIVSALSGSDVFRANYKNGVFYSKAAAPITSSDGMKGCVYFYEKDLTQGAFLRRTQVNLSKISIAIAFLGMVFVAIFSVVFGKRVNGLLNGIRSVREGEYTHVIALSGKTSFRRLQTSLTSFRQGFRRRKRFAVNLCQTRRMSFAHRLLPSSCLRIPLFRREKLMKKS